MLPSPASPGSISRLRANVASETPRAALSEDEAIADLKFDAFRDWNDPERVIINVGTLYREWRRDTSERDIIALYGRMHRWRQKHGHTGAYKDPMPPQ